MKCNICKKNEATVFLKKNINGEITETALCSECAKENSGITKEFDLFGNGFFGNILNPFSAVTTGEVKKCGLCGSTFDDIRKSGRIGCAECYDIFEDELRTTLNNLYGNAVYGGTLPEASGTKTEEKSQATDSVAVKKEELREAVASENYELAAKIRDEIKELEGKDNNE